METYTIAIPAYSRPLELIELFDSIAQMNMQPNEILICEDFSKDRQEIATIVAAQTQKFNKKNVVVSYFENEKNLGYDANIRKLIEKAQSKWVVLIGNDDLFLPNGLSEINRFCMKNSSLKMLSRTFIRFENNLEKPLGTSKQFETDKIITTNDSASNIFRLFGFVGGIVLNKEWANSLITNQYDGTLYYQIYLAANAYCQGAIGYISKPTVAARTGNPPMFGVTEDKNSVHIPGTYTAKGRAKMWKGVLDIAHNVGLKYNLDLLTSVKKELTVRQSFHVFEMNVGVSKNKLLELKNELVKIDLYNHWFPKTLYHINLIMGKYAYYFYSLTRKLKQ